MRVTSIDRYLPAPGRAVAFEPSAATLAVADGMPPSPVPPSFNQRFHLAGAERAAGGPRHWLACAFDLPGPVDQAALGETFTAWVRRHESLRSGFRRGAEPGAAERFLVPADKTELVMRDLAPEAAAPTGSAALRELLLARLNAVCHPMHWPPYLLAAVLRPDGATVFCGFDHSTMDAIGLAVAVHELHEIHAAGGSADHLPETGSFVDYCAREQERPPAAGREEPRLRGWAEFFAACGGTTPTFPLDLGVPPGVPAPQATDCRPLLDAHGADRLQRRCADAGAGVLAGVLTAFALAAHRLGGDPVLRVCTPLHTRHEERWRHAMGWFTTVAPVTLDVTGVRGLDDGVRRAAEAFRGARALAELPVAQVVPALGDSFRLARNDVFMVSYLDYRRLPGGDAHLDRAAHHVSAVTTADDAQFWVSRTHEGLFLRTRRPATGTAARSVGAFTDALSRALAPAAADG